LHKIAGSKIKRIPLESIFKNYPDKIVVPSEYVHIPAKLYNEIYHQTGVIDPSQLPLDEIQQDWPFLISFEQPLQRLVKPTISLTQKYKNFKTAVKSDPIFGLAAAGTIMQNAGTGILEGSLLISIMQMAQNELKVAALVTLLTKFSVGFYLLGNHKASGDVQELEANERLGNVLNQRVPLWEMGARFISNMRLIAREATISSIYLLTSVVYTQLFPPFFKGLWGFGAGKVAKAVFVAGYLFASFLNSLNDALNHRNLFKIAENRIRDNPKFPDFKKHFWTNFGFLENIEILSNQAAIVVGIGIYSLFAFLLPAAAPVVGIVMAAVGVLFTASRFMLPLFGREEKDRLIIESDSYVRDGRTVEFSDRVKLRIGNNVKVELIEEDPSEKVIIPDFSVSGVKLQLQEIDKITDRSGFLQKFLPRFLRRQTFVIKTKHPKDPTIKFILFGKPKMSAKILLENLQKYGFPLPPASNPV
jgi:hypothetical protein